MPGTRTAGPGDRVNQRRRLFLGAGAAVVAGRIPVLAHAQSPKVARIGFLGAISAAAYAQQLEGLRAGLRDFGYVEGKNLAIEFRWAEGKYERLPGLAAELVRAGAQVIVTHGTPGTQAARKATSTDAHRHRDSHRPRGKRCRREPRTPGRQRHRHRRSSTVSWARSGSKC